MAHAVIACACPSLCRFLLCRAAESDDFVAHLLEVMRSCGEPKQPATLAILRSDYMVDQSGPEPKIQQVELNHIACSFSRPMLQGDKC